MTLKTVVLPTARSIRYKILQSPSHSLLPRYITMSDFLSKAITVEGMHFIDEDTRVILLLEAADFKNFQKLQIERNFLSFSKNASQLLRFFEELSGELVSFEAIEQADVYAEYEEHLLVLKELLHRYEALCVERNLCDKIFLPKYYKLRSSYIKSCGAIEVEVSGMLTNFELSLLQEASLLVPVELLFEATPYNKKMQQKLRNLGIALKREGIYRIDLREKKILSFEKRDRNTPIYAYEVSSRVLQVALVKQKVYEFVQKGIDPQKIAVILPDENFKEYFELFDTKRNFNFAMGRGLDRFKAYQKLHATLEALDELSVENETRLDRVGDELYASLFGSYKKKVAQIDLESILNEVLRYAGDAQEEQLLLEQIYLFCKLLPHMQDLTLKAALKLFLSRLAQESVDDVGGGKITVMGVLETRGVAFEGVIVVDFNDSFVPKRVDKDMFLNSTLRKHAALPTRAEREALQKNYYYTLFQNAKEVAVSYVHTQEQTPSRFLKELEGVVNASYPKEHLSALLFLRGKKGSLTKIAQKVPYDFTKTKLSSTKLAVYLSCKRKFYYKYIRRLEEFELPQDLPKEWEIGKLLHSALKNLYMKKKHYHDKTDLCRDLEKELAELAHHNPLHRFQASMYVKVLQRFCQNEVQRFKQGYSVAYVEQPSEVQVGALTLSGVIDRIDASPKGTLEVLDYKSGKIKTYSEKTLLEADDFQLEFYFLLAKQFGEVERVAFYDLKEGNIVAESHFESKMERLFEHFAALEKIQEVETAMCEDTKRCRFCAYAILCGRA